MEKAGETHHLAELHRRLLHFLPYPYRNLSQTSQHHTAHEDSQHADSLTSLSSFTFAVRPSSASSFCPSRSSAKRCPAEYGFPPSGPGTTGRIPVPYLTRAIRELWPQIVDWYRQAPLEVAARLAGGGA